MPDVVERAIRPYNPPDANVISKGEYTMFTPIASPTNAGMLAYSDGDFLLKDGVLYLSSTYRAKIERAIALGDWLPEQVRTFELSLARAVGQKLAATPSAEQVSITDKYLFISEVGVLISAFPMQHTYTFKYENDSWYLTYDGANYELDDPADIGLSIPDNYTTTFTVEISYTAVVAGDTGYHDNALYYSQQASGSATQAANKALVSEGHATGTQNGEPVGEQSPYYHNNSKYYSEQAAEEASDAAGYAQNAADANSNAQIAAEDAKAQALKSEGYAVGTQNGASVGLQSIYYNNNSKYYSDRARALTQQAQWAAEGAATSENNARTYAQQADDSADAAEGYSEDAKDARDEIIGALGNGVSVLPHPRTVPMRDANSKLYAASPTTTDDDNVVATKGFVNSSVSTNTANFLGTYTYAGTDSHSAIAAWIPSQLPAGTIVTKNDYVFVQLTVDGNTKYERYKYNSNTAAWEYEYELNNSSFTAAQWAAINSGITSEDIATVQDALDSIERIIGEQQDDIDALESGKQNVIDSTHKLSSDLVDDTNSQTHKFVTPTEKATWNAKQAALTAGRNISLAGNVADFSIPFVVLSASAGDTIDVANGTVTLSANHSAVFANNDFVRVQCNDLFGNNGDTYVFQRTYNEPTANNEKIEYFEYVDVGFYGNPLSTKAHTYIFYYTTGYSPITLGFIDREADGGGASYTAGDGIDITNNVISVDLDYYTAEEIDTAMFGTYTVTGSITNGTATSTTIIARTSATATITITPDSGYTLPATVTATNATLTSYDDTTGIVTVSNPTDNVVVTAVCEAISYTITTSVTNGTYSGATSIAQGGTATVTISADSTYTLPSTITVSGATYTYDSSTGVISLSNPTGNVTITAVCESAQTMPVKGQIITMTLGNGAPAAGTNNTYRVLKVNGTQAEVVAMFDQSTSQMFDDNMDNTYAGSDLDTYLNTTWYGTLSSTAQAAIVAKSVQQYQYSTGTYSATTHASYADYSTKATKGSAISRNVYALDVEDIEQYFGGTSSTAGTFSTADIWTLFWNTTSAPGTPTYPWLRSARAGNSRGAFYVLGDYGLVDRSDVDNDYAARPAFTIDLSKISWA